MPATVFQTALHSANAAAAQQCPVKIWQRIAHFIFPSASTISDIFNVNRHAEQHEQQKSILPFILVCRSFHDIGKEVLHKYMAFPDSPALEDFLLFYTNQAAEPTPYLRYLEHVYLGDATLENVANFHWPLLQIVIQLQHPFLHPHTSQGPTSACLLCISHSITPPYHSRNGPLHSKSSWCQFEYDSSSSGLPFIL